MIDLGAWASESYRVPIAQEPDLGELADEFTENQHNRVRPH